MPGPVRVTHLPPHHELTRQTLYFGFSEYVVNTVSVIAKYTVHL